MIHHNQLEKFASRGLKAQAAVDEVIAAAGGTPALPGKTISPAGSQAGEVAHVTGHEAAGVPPVRRPRASSPRGGHRTSNAEHRTPKVETSIAVIEASTDVAWLQGAVRNEEMAFALRFAAERRLKQLRRAKR